LVQPRKIQEQETTVQIFLSAAAGVSARNQGWILCHTVDNYKINPRVNPRLISPFGAYSDKSSVVDPDPDSMVSLDPDLDSQSGSGLRISELQFLIKKDKFRIFSTICCQNLGSGSVSGLIWNVGSGTVSGSGFTTLHKRLVFYEESHTSRHL
jgi:hypothetical protein